MDDLEKKLLEAQQSEDPIIEGIDDIPADSYKSDEVEWEDGEGGSALIPDEVLHNNTPILNQGKTSACGTISLAKGENEMNYLEGTYNTIGAVDWLANWQLMKSMYGASEKSGSSMAKNLQMMRDKGWISGWVVAQSEQAQKEALARGQLIYCGSRYIDFAKCLWTRDAVFTNKPIYGHLWIRNGYSNPLGKFRQANSWGADKHVNGCFTTNYGQDLLYTPIILIDKNNSGIITQVKNDRQMIAESLERKIWNGQKPENPVVGYEIDIIISRFDKKASMLGANQTVSRQYAANIIISAFGLTNNPDAENKIWKKTNPEQTATREQFILMSMRAEAISKNLL